MLVIVLAMSRMAASVVNVVDMIAVRDRDVAATFAMDMVMILVH